jgi:cytochrome P450
MEVLRMSNVVALGVPHLAMNETQLLGFTIPKVMTIILNFPRQAILNSKQGSIVSINLNSVLRDAEMWQDPENFRPERHLDADGKLFRNEAFVPFGMGIIFVFCFCFQISN